MNRLTSSTVILATGATAAVVAFVVTVNQTNVSETYQQVPAFSRVETTAEAPSCSIPSDSCAVVRVTGYADYVASVPADIQDDVSRLTCAEVTIRHRTVTEIETDLGRTYVMFIANDGTGPEWLFSLAAVDVVVPSVAASCPAVTR